MNFLFFYRINFIIFFLSFCRDSTYKNISIKQDPGDFEPIIQLTEFPDKKKLEKVIKKLKGQTDSEDDAPLAKIKLSELTRRISTTSNKEARKKTNRKKSTPKKLINNFSDIDDTEDEDYLPSVSKNCKKGAKKSKKEENGDVKIKEEIEEEDCYQNPFNYGYHFMDTPVKKRKPFNKKSSASTKTSKSKWSCLICLADLATKESLIEHYQLHKEDPIKQEENLLDIILIQCQVCGHVVESDKELRKHSESHVDEKYQCEICNTNFKKAYEFTIHSRNHTEEPLLKCELCDFETIHYNQLKIHQQRHDTDFKYKCEICNKGFFIQSWYEEHKNFHTGAKPFICDVCEKPFAYTRYLTAHKRSLHPESYRDEPIINECVMCFKRFAHRKSLMLHMRGHTGENTVLCDICGKRLSSNEHLKFHRRIHTGYKPYKCDVCTKGFAKKCNLTLHLRVHSGEKPYVCDVCGKCFSQRSTLVIHERYHTGSRPYTCHLCHKGFVAKGVLSIHLKSCSRNTIMSNIIE